MSNVLIRRDNEAWREPEKSGYTDEAHLQGIMLEHPWLIPGVKKSVQIYIEF